MVCYNKKNGPEADPGFFCNRFRLFKPDEEDYKMPAIIKQQASVLVIYYSVCNWYLYQCKNFYFREVLVVCIQMQVVLQSGGRNPNIILWNRFSFL